jgi:hypothetical protein
MTARPYSVRLIHIWHIPTDSVKVQHCKRCQGSVAQMLLQATCRAFRKPRDRCRAFSKPRDRCRAFRKPRWQIISTFCTRQGPPATRTWTRYWQSRAFSQTFATVHTTFSPSSPCHRCHQRSETGTESPRFLRHFCCIMYHAELHAPAGETQVMCSFFHLVKCRVRAVALILAHLHWLWRHSSMPNSYRCGTPQYGNYILTIHLASTAGSQEPSRCRRCAHGPTGPSPSAKRMHMIRAKQSSASRLLSSKRGLLHHPKSQCRNYCRSNCIEHLSVLHPSASKLHSKLLGVHISKSSIWSSQRARIQELYLKLIRVLTYKSFQWQKRTRRGHLMHHASKW